MSLTRKLGQAVPGSSAEHSLAKQALLASAAYPERQGDYHGNADFLDLAPDTRNQIYEYAYRFHSRIGQQISVCNEEGAREVRQTKARRFDVVRDRIEQHPSRSTTSSRHCLLSYHHSRSLQQFPEHASKYDQRCFPTSSTRPPLSLSPMIYRI